MLERATGFARRSRAQNFSIRPLNCASNTPEVCIRFSSTLNAANSDAAAPAKIDFRSRMMQAPVAAIDPPPLSKRKLGPKGPVHRAPAPSQVSNLLSPEKVNIKAAYNAASKHIQEIVSVEVTNSLTHHWSQRTPEASVPLPARPTGTTDSDWRRAMVQGAANYSLSRKKNNPRSSRELNFSSNVQALMAQYNRAKTRGPALLGNLVEALSRAHRFKEALRRLEEMEKAGYQMKPAYARAKALLLVFQSHIQAAIDWLFSWVDSFLQRASSTTSFEYEREFKQLYSVYVAVFEQLFRRGYPHLAHSVAKHAEEKKIDISGATLTLMVPHLLKRMDMESIIKQSITRHMQQEGHVPAETLRVLISACIKQRQLELASSLVDTFIDAKRAQNQRLDSSECRDLLFIFVSLGRTEHAENLLEELYRRGTLDERVVSTIVHALSMRGIKSELRNLPKQLWWNHASTSASVYSLFFTACCKAGDFETAITEFERLASSMPSGVTEMFESLLTAFAKYHRTAETSRMFQILQNSKLELSGDILAAVLNMYCSIKNVPEASKIASIINEKQVKYTSKLVAAMMSFNELSADPRAVLQLLDRARTERIVLTPGILARGLKACAELENIDLAVSIFHEASQWRILTDPILLRTWFCVCGRLKATGILHSTWNAIKSNPDIVLDESVWVQAVAAFCMSGNTRGALAALSESLMDSLTGIRLSVLYPRNILTKTMILQQLKFLPSRAQATIRDSWRVSVQLDPNALYPSFRDEVNSAPRLSESDREAFAAMVNEWIHLYDSTDNAHVSERTYYDSKQQMLGIRTPSDFEPGEPLADGESVDLTADEPVQVRPVDAKKTSSL
eukprot:TRINITY_DN3175_c0_g1_i1.p1 TRINITY_DN3175_c0_g1~~TRINITY_DN3175_c0_g1_i1.p1  ORF type:complete len:850 (-),score=105.82 TRINITY_DN3175_c0_g1_i1:3-2552(-)